MIYILPVLKSSQTALCATLRMLPTGAEVVIAADLQDVPAWLNTDTVRIFSEVRPLPGSMAREHRTRVHLHAALTQLMHLGCNEAVWVPTGTGCTQPDTPFVTSGVSYGSKLSAHPYSYLAELQRAAFILEREGFIPRMYAAGAPLKIDLALADITLTRYGYRTHFDSMYLRGNTDFIQALPENVSKGTTVNRDSLYHLFTEQDAQSLCDSLPQSRFEV